MHIPVLFEQTMNWLQPRSGGRYIDATLGGAGHAAGILERSAPTGLLLGLDADPEAIARAESALAPFGNRAILVHSNFREMGRVAEQHGFGPADGILLDLGLSSYQLDHVERGFSFQHDAPLDMRFDPGQEVAARDLVNNLDQDELADILWSYGDERRSRRIARAIVAARPIESTLQLAELVRRAYRSYRSRTRIHPATRVFQALRMAVNDELGALQEGIEAALALLAPGARLAVIAFHSGEDRVVKQFMRREGRDCICPPEAPICVCGHKAQLDILTRKPIRPSDMEIERNPRSRSARLRVAERL